MTLILGLKTDDCVVIGAEQEEVSGIVAKRSVTKLRLVTGSDWSVVVGGAGDAALAENAMRDMARRLKLERVVNEQVLMETIDEILDVIHTKYVDKDPKSEGLSLVIGASCGDGLHLISTLKRVPQPQDHIAYAGIGADIGIYFMDRLHRTDANWTYTATAAGFILQQALESCQYCGGESEIYVLQSHPNPRWRSLGVGDAPIEFMNQFQHADVADHLQKLVKKAHFNLEDCIGYRGEHRPIAATYEERFKKINDSIRQFITEKQDEKG